MILRFVHKGFIRGICCTGAIVGLAGPSSGVCIAMDCWGYQAVWRGGVVKSPTIDVSDSRASIGFGANLSDEPIPKNSWTDCLSRAEQ